MKIKTKETILHILWFGTVLTIGILCTIIGIVNYTQEPLGYTLIATFGMLIIILNVGELLLQHYGY